MNGTFNFIVFFFVWKPMNANQKILLFLWKIFGISAKNEKQLIQNSEF